MGSRGQPVLRLPQTVVSIGITGGVAAGKSLVAEAFAELGAGILDADQAVHEILNWPGVKNEIEQKFGSIILKSDGTVDRTRLAQLCFDSSSGALKARKWLEGLLHPRVAELFERQAEQLVAAGKTVIVLDVPLLYEVGWDKSCSVIVFVDAHPELRKQRAATRGWSAAEFAQREAAQGSLELKRQQAHFVVDNNHTPGSVRDQVAAIWHRLTGKFRSN